MRGAWLDCFEFKEFEEFFEIDSDTLRPFGWRRIAFPFGGTPPPARHLLACPPSFLWQGTLAGHFWNVLSPLGRLLWSLEAFLEPPGASWRPPGASLGALGGVWEPLGRLLGRLTGDPKQQATPSDF